MNILSTIEFYTLNGWVYGTYVNFNNTAVKKKKKEKKYHAGQHRLSAQQVALQELGPSQAHGHESCSFPDLPEVWEREPQVEKLGTGPAVHLQTLRKALQSMGPGQKPGLSRCKDKDGSSSSGPWWQSHVASLMNCGVRVEPVSRRLDETMSKLHQKECQVLMSARDREGQG